ncbi:hypothetical protein FQN55_000221 [Onygenales sp. PD_40]|nr:hypothetical protein FQN55_000221 [Onygenales sp. PD_40]
MGPWGLGTEWDQSVYGLKPKFLERNRLAEWGRCRKRVLRDGLAENSAKPEKPNLNPRSTALQSSATSHQSWGNVFSGTVLSTLGPTGYTVYYSISRWGCWTCKVLLNSAVLNVYNSIENVTKLVHGAGDAFASTLTVQFVTIFDGRMGPDGPGAQLKPGLDNIDLLALIKVELDEIFHPQSRPLAAARDWTKHPLFLLFLEISI